MAFKSDTFRRPDGRWVFIATEDGRVFEYVNPVRWEPITKEDLLKLKYQAMDAFDEAARAGR